MPQVINPSFPIVEIHSVEELMDIAATMEREAAERYEQLAAAMAQQHEPELARVFRELAVLEREHEAGLGRWAARQGWRSPRLTPYPWPMPETFGTEADGAEAHVLTPYRALSIAVRNEEKAFAFFTYLAALSPNQEVRHRAEALAREELDHVAQLRVLRRRAYHADLPRGRRAIAHEPGELVRLAHGLEAAAAEVDGVAAAVLAQAGHHAAAAVLRRTAAESAQRAAAFAAAGEEPGSSVAVAARQSGLLEPGALTPFGALRLALRDAEEVLDIYLAVADHAGDETVVAAVQDLAESAVARLAQIRTLLADHDD